jgi:hypothetical protein
MSKKGGIPVEQPIKFDFAINTKTATALGLSYAADLAHRRR